MPSVDSVIDALYDLRGSLLLEMQDDDQGYTEVEFSRSEWADEMYRAWSLLGQAIKHLEAAERA